METDIYKTPQADLTGAETDSQVDSQFYVVSNTKFLLLYFFTLGLYTVYWFYRNWSLYKQSTGESMWPVMRGIFSIFFTHSLFKRVDERLQAQTVAYHWTPTILATVYVVSAVVANISDRLSMKNIGTPVTDFLGLLLLVTAGWALYKGQGAINTACNDPAGSSNSTITVANLVWIILGALFWGLVLIGSVATLTGNV